MTDAEVPVTLFTRIDVEDGWTKSTRVSAATVNVRQSMMALPPIWVTSVRLALVWSTVTCPAATCSRMGAVWAAAIGTMNRLKVAPLRSRLIRDAAVFQRGVICKAATPTPACGLTGGVSPDVCDVCVNWKIVRRKKIQSAVPQNNRQQGCGADAQMRPCQRIRARSAQTMTMSHAPAACRAPWRSGFSPRNLWLPKSRMALLSVRVGPKATGLTCPPSAPMRQIQGSC